MHARFSFASLWKRRTHFVCSLEGNTLSFAVSLIFMKCMGKLELAKYEALTFLRNNRMRRTNVQQRIIGDFGCVKGDHNQRRGHSCIISNT